MTAKRITVITTPIYFSLGTRGLTLLMAYGIANTPGPVVLLIRAMENYYGIVHGSLLETETDRRIHQPVEILCLVMFLSLPQYWSPLSLRESHSSWRFHLSSPAFLETMIPFPHFEQTDKRMDIDTLK